MLSYLNEILRDFPELLGDIVTSPAAGHLFKVRPDDEARLLLEEHAISFRHFVARDIQIAVVSLTTRV